MYSSMVWNILQKKILLTGLTLNIQEDSDLSRLAIELIGKFLFKG
jgi:hypothetical protein